MNSRPLILYFGSFNPVHSGHIAVAEAALRHFGGEADLWFMLSARNPFKTEAEMWPDDKRWALLNEALAGRAGMRACDLELHLPRPSYTVHTLERVRAQEGTARPLYLLMGEDNLAKFTDWRSFETILDWCRVLVYPRATADGGGDGADRAVGGTEAVPRLPESLTAYAQRFILLRGALLPQNSTYIRQRAARPQAAATDPTATQALIGHTPEDWAKCLQWRGAQAEALREAAREVKLATVGPQVYLRGLIEYSNICRKNCFYCGIRAGNPSVSRYAVTEAEVLTAVENAYRAGFGSIVLQSGERQDAEFIDTIERLLQEITRRTDGRLGITLSLGEQTLETYGRWRAAGATRYLLRIETSNPALYAQLHPADHRFDDRIKALEALKAADYMVGSGVMIGLPGQTEADLAGDLAFFRDFGIDMVGMGPYIEHRETPLYARRNEIPTLAERYELSLNMLALLRLIMPTLNMAATTAMASLHPQGREAALRIAANVIMPNITPGRYRENYFLYENKLCICGSEQDVKDNIEALVRSAGCELRYFEKGDPRHYHDRKQNLI
ncbi:MAG: [FeFe] hydrogenase H-cluster radical SAM maturase HydE [Bacteroidales bacterium]|nr:[FeFe] hydrogenase H-cluster radical SAM maturase HydE [Bacteroidales bacterium]